LSSQNPDYLQTLVALEGRAGYWRREKLTIPDAKLTVKQKKEEKKSSH
jgi:hypothetical protein